MKIRTYKSKDEAEVIALWKECGLLVPWNDPHQDILRKLSVSPEWFLVLEHAGGISGTCMVGYDGHRGWINYLAVAPGCRRKGCGAVLMKKAEALLEEANCPKVNLQVRSSNSEVIEFYQGLGYQIDPVVSLGKRLINDLNKDE